MNWADIFPYMSVKILCGELTLSAMTPNDVGALIAAADEGVVIDGAPYPFVTDWATLPRQTRIDNSARFYFSKWASFTVEGWTLLMVAREGDKVVGAQDLMGGDFRLLRRAETGSWLAAPYRGRGLGTLMRQMVGVLAFDHLGAVELRTSAFADNPASLRVSEKLGYQRINSARSNRLGEVADMVDLKLLPGNFVRPNQPVEVTGVGPLRTFLGIDER